MIFPCFLFLRSCHAFHRETVLRQVFSVLERFFKRFICVLILFSTQHFRTILIRGILWEWDHPWRRGKTVTTWTQFRRRRKPRLHTYFPVLPSFKRWCACLVKMGLRSTVSSNNASSMAFFAFAFLEAFFSAAFDHASRGAFRPAFFALASCSPAFFVNTFRACFLTVFALVFHRNGLFAADFTRSLRASLSLSILSWNNRAAVFRSSFLELGFDALASASVAYATLWEVSVAPHSCSSVNLETIMSRERRGCAGWAQKI